MQGFNSLRKAVESVKDLNCRWHRPADSKKHFNYERLLRVADNFDKRSEAGSWRCFVSMEESGEIAIVYPSKKEVDLIFLPEGSRYHNSEKDKRELFNEAEKAIVPVMKQMLIEQAGKSARIEILTSDYHIDKKGQVMGHAPAGLRWPYAFKKPGQKRLKELESLGEGSKKIYETISRKCENLKNGEKVYEENTSWGLAKEISSTDLWKKIFNTAIKKAGKKASDRIVFRDFQWDNLTQKKIGAASSTLRQIKNT